MKFIFTFITAVLLFIPSFFSPNSITRVERVQEKKIENKSKEQILLESMTLEEKVGQLFIFGFDGTTLTESNRNFLTQRHIGGVILFSKNISNEQQLKDLTTNIQSLNRIPLFVSIDQEGGVVSRIKWNDVLTKSQSNISNPQEAYNIAKSRGDLLKQYGINMNLAPVIEYSTNTNSFMYKRVFRGSLEEVIQKGIYSVNGYKDAGILAVPKHYPGHGDTLVDSHYSLPVVDVTDQGWNEYTRPFIDVIQGSNPDGIMVGHIKYPNIDTLPSTMSGKIIEEKLKTNLNYNGLVISDDMEMDALEGFGTHQEMAKSALLAGNDILIYSKYREEIPTIQKDVYEYLLEECRSGNINIEEKVLRILKMKYKYGIIN